MSLLDKAAFKFEQTDDRQINQLQRNLQALSQSVVNLPWANGTTTGAVTFTAGGTQTISHKLGRMPRGFFPIDVTGDYGSFLRGATTATSLDIQSLNACTATFWVY